MGRTPVFDWETHGLDRLFNRGSIQYDRFGLGFDGRSRRSKRQTKTVTIKGKSLYPIKEQAIMPQATMVGFGQIEDILIAKAAVFVILFD
ncbi:MAG: hypothetical protein BZY80_01010 [SAR202 cluster bacterium Io17-Chloro-G2]|nr:MAG: hypothetical protein BZY80_01010 [SAR202 cluster bacterium Io17-Chloro-G2]